MLAVTVLGSGIAALDATVVNIALPTIQAPTLGWSSLTVLAMAVAGARGLAAFLVRDHTAAWPTLPLGVFREWQFAATNAATFIMYAALTGATFLLPIQLQVVSGYSPLASGLALLPLTLIMLALSARSGRLATRIGPRLQMSADPVIVGAGLALLVFSNYGSSYVVCVLPAVVVFGLGRAVTVAPLTATAMSSAPAEHPGIASAVNNDVARWAAWPGPSMGERSEWSSEPIGPPVHQPTRLPPGPAASERSLCATAAAETPHSQSRPDRQG